MKGVKSLFTTGLLACSAYGRAVQQRSAFAVKDSHHVPKRWKHVGYPEPDHTIALRIGLKQGSFLELERHLCKNQFLGLYLLEISRHVSGSTHNGMLILH